MPKCLFKLFEEFVQLGDSQNVSIQGRMKISPREIREARAGEVYTYGEGCGASHDMLL